MTLAYIYFADGVYHQFNFEEKSEEESEEESEKEKINREKINKKSGDKINKKSGDKINKFIKLLGIYVIIVFLTIYIGKKYIIMENNKN
jgi:hypothetical protein